MTAVGVPLEMASEYRVGFKERVEGVRHCLSIDLTTEH
jgi:hypothetical protein